MMTSSGERRNRRQSASHPPGAFCARISGAMQAPALHARCAPFAAGNARRGAPVSLAAPRPVSRRVRFAPCTAALDAGTLSAATTVSSGPAWQLVAGLGTSAVGFFATFFVAPRFREQFKENDPWESIYPVLVKQGVSPIKPADAAKRRGALLLDVRLSEAVAKASVPRAVAVPLYVPIQKWDVFSNVRRVAFAFFGIAGTELNPEFLSGVDAATKGNKNAELVVFCERGGSLENRPQMKLGFQSRSLKALFYLRRAGYRNVRHLTGGISAWAADGLPVEDGQQ
jgi:hypothetical protein